VKKLTSFFLFVFFCFYVAAGYELEFNEDTVVYARAENKPFADMVQLGILKKGMAANALGCMDDKTDIYIYIDSALGGGYLYDFNFKSEKAWSISMDKIKYILMHPVGGIQCLTVISRVSS